MIHTFRAQNYGCLLDVTAALTPLHAFIGPNDSGKSTLLHGMRTVVQLASGHFEVDKKGTWKPFDPFLSADKEASTSATMLECVVAQGWYAIKDGPGEGSVEEFVGNGEWEAEWEAYRPRRDDHADRAWSNPRTLRKKVYDPVFAQLRGARLARFDPDALRKPSGLLPETQPVSFLDDRGHGLAGAYFAIRNRDDSTFSTIVDGVRRHFPTIQSLRVKAVSSSEVVLEAQLAGGQRVEARRMSEGLLYYLAFAALPYLDPVSLLLVEEPENGLHPARIAEVMRILREVSRSTQVLLATHSPLVINELQPEEVSVVTRTPERGTRVTPILETHNFRKRSSVYALGELWLSYANGVDEAALIDGQEAP